MKSNPNSAAVRELINSPRVTAATRRVLLERLDFDPNYQPRFFDSAQFETLKALCAALAPSAGGAPREFVAAEIDHRLANGDGDGWRYAEMPADGDVYQTALQIFDRAALELHGKEFAALADEERRLIVRQIAGGEVESTVNPSRLLEELFTESVEIFYSHPLALQEIGYAGFADAIGEEGEKGRKGEGEIINEPFDNSHSPILPFSPSQTRTADVVIIGTGAGGAPVLARLAQAGLRVVALEAGRAFDYREFPTDERAQAKLFWRDERLSAGDDPPAFGRNNSGCGVGGSTVHFTAYTPRPQPDDFRLFSEFGVGRDWCLTYEDLEPYFDELEWFLGVSGNSDYPWGKKRRRGYPLAPLELNAAARLMQKGCVRLGIATSPAPNAALSSDYVNAATGERRRACTNRGYCQAGCSTGAKGSMDATFIPAAARAGAIVLPESFALEFELDSNKKIKAVVFERDGKREKINCAAVFLCAGAIESPRLLLLNDLANSSGQVGKNFMAHPGVQIWGAFDEPTFPNRGIPGGLISEDTHRPQKRFGADFAGGYLLQSIGVMPVTYVSQLARGEKLFGAEIDEWMRDYNHTAGINILGECLPSERNFLELSDERDARGLPKPRVSFSAGANERAMMHHAENLMREIWREAGARKMWSFERYAHTLGTCRMGRDAAENVVDENCRSFDVPNLYVCDNSIFPSALAVNPSLTQMALALRAADKFLENL